MHATLFRRVPRPRLPESAPGWIRMSIGVLAALVVVTMVFFVLRPLLADPHGYGRPGWDAMESTRYLVARTIRRFHEFPSWNPYACGGHPAWAGFEGDPVVVAPWFPAYLSLSLPVALRVEIVASALWGAAGAWGLASRFTRSRAVCAFVAVVFAVNGRWTLQLAAGHAWHLVYAWTPWALFFFDRAVGAEPALGPPRPRNAVWTGVCLAMMVYTGGADPLSETAVVLVAYAVILAITTRAARPLGSLAIAAAVALGLSAPKLLPTLALMRRYPAGADAPESLSPGQLTALLTDRVQGFSTGHAGVGDGSWHDVGMYLGWTVVIALVVGLVAARGARVTALKAIGLLFLVLGLGSFSPYAPWSLARHLPFFDLDGGSARWLYPASLIFACVTAAAIEQAIARAGRGRVVLEGVLLLAVAWIARDVGTVARFPLEAHLRDAAPREAESGGPFRTEARPAGDHGPGTLSAERANVGVLECSTFRRLDAASGEEGRPAALGARAVGDQEYHGEAYLSGGVGTATITEWRPNTVEVRVDGATPGEDVIVNENWDPGWTVDGATALDHEATIASRVTAPTQVFRFAYQTPLRWPGCALFVATVAALVFARWATRRPLSVREPASSPLRVDPAAPP